jgi:alpha-L-arabinofuranosidase
MSSISRRRFVQQTSVATCAYGASLAAPSCLVSAFSESAADAPARLYVDCRRTSATLDRNLFGSFLEHLGRAIYEGIYDPGSKLADPNGFRKDVLQEVRALSVPLIRYPGGNFVSGYRWLDGVGPKDKRPRKLDRAWNTLEPNQFGTNEFMAWCKAAGAEPLIGLNFGTGTPEDAAALVEYCNVREGTQWSDLRRAHGVPEPHNVRRWCLGNEMDGPWQIGHMTANEYGLKAADAARQMRYVDSSLQLIACGSSGPLMPTYLEWDREVLEQCYDYVDAISLHRYFDNSRETGGDSSKFLALNLSMERQIDEVAAVCDLVQGRRRSPKKLWLSFDEWNVWYRARSGDAVNGNRQEAPHLLEEVYNLEDALLVGGLLNSLIRKAGRVRVACLAQLVNVIAPLITNRSTTLRQTIYYPYSWALQSAQGSVLDLLLESSSYEVPDLGHVNHLDVAGTVSGDKRSVSLFVLNRDLSKSRKLEVNWQDQPMQLLQSSLLTGDDLKATNTFDSPTRVKPSSLEKPVTTNGKTILEFPPRSYTALRWTV